MEPREYETLATIEEDYWWYQGLRAGLSTLLDDLGLDEGARVLDAGCGTGKNAEWIEAQYGVKATGFDFSPHAAERWSHKGFRHGCLCSADAIPFAAETFDLVISVNVLESRGLDSAEAVNEMARVLRPGGRLLLVLSAYPWLYSEHDRAVHAARRFTRADTRALMAQNDLELERVTNLFALLFPFVALVRVLSNASGVDESPESDLKPLPSPLNALLAWIVRSEAALLSWANLPVGTSIIAVGRKGS